MLNPPNSKRLFFYKKSLTEKDYSNDGDECVETEPHEANLVSSECEDGLHRPALDLDLSAEIYPSSTPGHFHLYIDKPMSWSKYVKLLDALAEAGVVHPDYVKWSKERQQTLLRLPHIRKT